MYIESIANDSLAASLAQWQEGAPTGDDPLPDLSLAGEGGTNPGAFATTPTNNNYSYVAQSATQGLGANVDALMAGSKWSGQDATAHTVITYSFANPQASTYSYSSMGDFITTLSAFSEADKALTRSMLATISAVCNVDFVEVPDNAAECGVLRYGYSQEPNTLSYAGYAFFPSSNAMGGDIWIGAEQAKPVWDFYRPNLILHETLHAIGLKHPFDNTGAVLSTSQDIIPNTVMSYSPVAGGNSGWMSKYPGEPMPLDIAALQYLYGAAQTNAGNTVYDLSSTEFQGFNALWDAGGNDTLDASHLSRGVTLDLRDGVASDIGTTINAMAKAASGTTLTTAYTSTLSIANGASIENAIGSSYNDVIAGNDLANAISGGAGSDRLEGRGGNDTLDGGTGVDTAVIDGSHVGYSIAKAGTGYELWGSAGVDELTNVERLAFNDGKIALDLDGNAGTAAKLIGVMAGGAAAHNATYLGQAIAALDSGISVDTVMHAVIGMRLGAAPSNDAVAALIITNLVGAPATPGAIDAVGNLIDSGAYTQTSLAVAAMNHEWNLENIDLVGMAAHGVEYF